jgi:hypothetical protein
VVLIGARLGRSAATDAQEQRYDRAESTTTNKTSHTHSPSRSFASRGTSDTLTCSLSRFLREKAHQVGPKGGPDLSRSRLRGFFGGHLRRKTRKSLDGENVDALLNASVE